MAEDLWNSCDPERVAAAYTEDCQWRNRTEFLQGRRAIVDFLRRKWDRELGYKLKKELWGFRGNRMAVKFQYEYGMTTAEHGFGASATNCGSLRPADSCRGAKRASTICPF